MNKVYTSFLVCFMSVLAARPNNPAQADSMPEGEELYARHEYEKAALCFLKEVRAHKGNAAAHYYLGNSYLQLKRKEDAIKEYEQAAALDPSGSAGEYSRTALESLRQPAQLPAPAPVPV